MVFVHNSNKSCIILLLIVHVSKRHVTRQQGGGLPFCFVSTWLLHSSSGETLWEGKETACSLGRAVSDQSDKIRLKFECSLFLSSILPLLFLFGMRKQLQVYSF